MKNKIYKISFLLALGILFAAPLFTSAQTQTYPDGTLIRAEGNPKVFVIYNGKKRWLRNEAIFESYKHSWDAVEVLLSSEVDEISYNNLIRADGTKVYALNDLGYKRHIFNPDIFNSYNLSWDDVADINETELENYPDSNLIRQAGDEKVYYIEGSNRRWVESIEAFDANNFNWDAVQIINDIDINHYSIGVDVTVNVQVNIPETLSINGITPNQITNNQSTNVTITGNNFQSDATVKIGTSSYATNVNVLNSTTITATIPSGLAVGAYNIIVTNPDNTSATLTNAITVSAPVAPVVLSVASITPTQILNNIDNYLTISGTNFKTGATVKIGSQSAASITVVNSTTISAKITSGFSVGTYSIQVRNPDGKTSTLANALSVIAPPVQEPPQLTTSEIFSLVSPAVVQIQNDKNEGCPCTGSGMIIDASGNILTNEHVIKNDDVVEVKLHNGTVVTGSIIGWNEVIDLAIIKINYNNLSTVSFGDSDNVDVGDNVYVLGHPLGLSSATIEAGIITSKQTLWGLAYLQTDANTQPGSSGGPWVDDKAQVIGVHQLGLKYPGTDIKMGMNFAIPINTAKSILNDLKSGAKVGLPDTTEPVISNIQVSKSFDSATITWTTDEPATSKVEYGLTGSYGTTISDSTLVTSHSLTITDLEQGTTYYFRVISEDASSNQSVSSSYSFTTLGTATPTPTPDTTPPADVINFTASAGDGQIALFWTNPINEDFAGTKILRKAGSYPTDVADGTEIYDGTGTSYTDTGLTNGTTYYYKAYAYDEVPNYSSGIDVSATPVAAPSDTTPPVITEGPTCDSSSITDSSVIITWTTDEPSDSQIEYGLTTDYGNSTVLDTTFVTTHSQTLNGLNSSTTYHYRVKSKDLSGNRVQSEDKTFTTSPPPDTTPPVITEGPTCDSRYITESSVLIIWTTDEDSTSVVEYGLTNAYGDTESSTDYVTPHSISLTNLEAETTYHYKVGSTDQSENTAWSEDKTFTTESDPFAGVSCTITVPTDYSTIQAAIDAAQSGDTICVAAGTYQEESIKIIGKDIILKGAGADQTIIESLIGDETPSVSHPEKHSAIDMQNVSSASKIEGFTIKNAYYYGIHLTNASPIIQSNEITGNGLGIKIVENSQPAITYNIFSNNTGHTIGHNGPLGGFVISHNTFVGNGNYEGNSAVLFNPVRSGQYIYPAEPITVSDNIIVDGVTGVREANNVSNFIVRNNLFYNNSESNVRTLSGYYNTTEEINGLSYASDNIVTNPQFVSSTDYNLQPGSPAIGAASDGGNIGAY